MKLRNLIVILLYVFSLSSIMAVSCLNGMERQLLMTAGYDGDFTKIRWTVVQDYDCELQSRIRVPKKPQETWQSRMSAFTDLQKKMAACLWEILNNVQYPVGIKTLVSEKSTDWNALVGVIDKDSRNRKAEFEGFCRAVRSILSFHEIDLDVLKLFQYDGADINESLISADAFHLSEFEAETDTLFHLTKVEDEDEDKELKLISEKLLARILVRRLVVCLPTYAEVHFWSLRNARSPEFYEEFGEFRGFEESLDKSLLEMRYTIRTNPLGEKSKKLEKWMLDNFVGVYERFPVIRNIKRDPDALLRMSIPSMMVTDQSVVPTLKKLGEAVLAAQRHDTRYREIKPFVIVYGVKAGDIKRYLTSVLGMVVHEVSADQYTEGNVSAILGRSCSWKTVANVENVGDIKLDRGWVLDTFMEKDSNGGPFLNNVLLIRDSEKFLDKDAAHGSIDGEMFRYWRDLVSENCSSVEVPYLGIRVSAKHLITIMSTERESVEAEMGTTVDIRGALELGISQSGSTPVVDEVAEVGTTVAVRGALELGVPRTENMPTDRAEENIPERSESQEISHEECNEIIRSVLREQGKYSKEHFYSCRTPLINILSGKRQIFPPSFDCSEATQLAFQQKNFLESRSSESLALVRALIEGYVRKSVKG